MGSFPIYFTYILTATPGANYKWLAMIIAEKDIMTDSTSAGEIIHQA